MFSRSTIRHRAEFGTDWARTSIAQSVPDSIRRDEWLFRARFAIKTWSMNHPIVGNARALFGRVRPDASAKLIKTEKHYVPKSSIV
jgi:hypothetical protein